MPTADLLTAWTALSPTERSVVRDVYLDERSFADTAERHRMGVADVLRALHSAYRQIAASVLEPDTPPVVEPTAAVQASLRDLVELPSASWRWDTSREEMTWSDGLFDLYGYPVGAVRPTIGVHQSHKNVDDRTKAEGLVLASATLRGPVVFPQQIIRTDGTVCRVVMHVVREPGAGEVLTGRVVADPRPGLTDDDGSGRT